MRALGIFLLSAACGGSGSAAGETDAGTAPPAPPDAAIAAAAPADAATPGKAAAASAVACFEEDEAPAEDPAADDRLSLTPATFADLPGWTDDRHAEALPALLASCTVLAGMPDAARIGLHASSGRASDWRAACAAAAKLPAGDHAAARAFFEAEFLPYAAAGRAGRDGKMTGYYVQGLRGSRTRQGRYQTPIYSRPPNLVSVDLALFLPDARGRRVWGQVDAAGAVTPMPTRAEIRAGALAGRKLELLWVDDPIDALFANIEGSGVVHLDDGTKVRIEFAGKNGRTYRGVAGVLRSMGHLPPGTGTMPGIRAWFQANPGRIDEVLDQIPSMVFFKLSAEGGAMGSQGVVLTAERSVAVDRNFVAASTPLWIETRAPVPGKSGSAPWHQLAIAQDTGGGIKGAVRADIYWGDDAAAADRGGRMGGRGRYWLLLPRRLQVRGR